jgi:23S rRNA (cytidine1920-2'-O)/16S rRNA (cytidine1409-2'-O)-methyltransferase
MSDPAKPFVSRAGQKLEHAMQSFALDAAGKTAADLGSNTGGFVDCLLRRGAARVYAIDTGYGVLDWKLRNDPRVVVMERTNAMHVTLPEKVQIVTIDVAWTKQQHILPAAARVLEDGGAVVSLIKPHYESPPQHLRGGVLPEERLSDVLNSVKETIDRCGFELIAMIPSPIKGSKGNAEYLAHLRRKLSSG